MTGYVDDCKGCRTYTLRQDYDPRTPPECSPAIVKDCPCILCIIKAMCETECEAYPSIKECHE